MQLDEFYTIIMKEEKTAVEILDPGHSTYSVNTFKFEYIGSCTPRTARILNLVVCW